MRRDPNSPITRYNAAINWILRESSLRSPGRLRKVGGRFVGVYHAYPNPGYEVGAAVIGLCRSDDLKRWEVEPPCLDPREGAEWEKGGLYKPCLVEHRGTYYLFYNAKNDRPRGWREQTGVATSTDLKSWKRYEGNPILPNGGAGSPDEIFASDPCVVIDGSKWVMFTMAWTGKARPAISWLSERPRFTLRSRMRFSSMLARRARLTRRMPTNRGGLASRGALSLLLRGGGEVSKRNARHLGRPVAALVLSGADSHTSK